MKNTLCQNCIFSKNVNSDNPCVFDIPNLIKENFSVLENNGYYQIINYGCRYGFGKKTYEENIDKLHNLDMKEYVKNNNIVKYSLALCVEGDNSKILVDNLNKLSIKPSYVTIICNNNGQTLAQTLKNTNYNIPYKIHNFLEYTSFPKSLHIALETNKNKIKNLLWILQEKDLDYVVNNDSIQNINYLINVAQPPSHYYKCKTIDSQFGGIFINSNNYWTLSRTENYEIENNENTLVVFYD